MKKIMSFAVSFVLLMLVSVTPASAAYGNTVAIGQTIQLYNGEVGTKTWFSNDPSIATVISQDGNRCTVLGKAEGSVLIVAQIKYTQNVSAQLPAIGGGTFWGVRPETRFARRNYSVEVVPTTASDAETNTGTNTSTNTDENATISALDGFTVGNTYLLSDFDKVDNLFHGLAAVRKNGKIGFVDENLKLVIPLQYDFNGLVNNGGMDYYKFNKYGITVVHHKYPNGTWISDSIIDKTGKTILAPDFFKYCITRTSTDGELIYVRRFDRGSLDRPTQWGAYDMQGNIVIPFKSGMGENIDRVRGENWSDGCVYFDESGGTPIDAE